MKKFDERLDEARQEAVRKAQEEFAEQRNAENTAIANRLDDCFLVLKAAAAVVMAFVAFDYIYPKMSSYAIFGMTCFVGMTTMLGVSLLGRCVKSYIMDGQFVITDAEASEQADFSKKSQAA